MDTFRENIESRRFLCSAIDRIGRSFAKAPTFIILCLTIFLAVCGCTADKAGQRSAKAPLEVMVSGKFVKIYLSGQDEELEKPVIRAADKSKLKKLTNDYFTFLQRGNKKKALALYLPAIRNTEDKLIEKDVELAVWNSDIYSPSDVSIAWYQDGKLWRRKQAVLLDNTEIERLVKLSHTYKKAAVIIVNLNNGDTRKMMVVEHGGKFYFLP